MAKKQVHVAVVGAGLGGLAAAIGISRAGHRLTILEQAPMLSEVSKLSTIGTVPTLSCQPSFQTFPSTVHSVLLKKTH